MAARSSISSRVIVWTRCHHCKSDLHCPISIFPLPDGASLCCEACARKHLDECHNDLQLSTSAAADALAQLRLSGTRVTPLNSPTINEQPPLSPVPCVDTDDPVTNAGEHLIIVLPKGDKSGDEWVHMLLSNGGVQHILKSACDDIYGPHIFCAGCGEIIRHNPDFDSPDATYVIPSGCERYAGCMCDERYPCACRFVPNFRVDFDPCSSSS